MDANQCDRRSTDDTTRYAAIARASVDRLVDFVNAKNRVQLGNVMGCDGVDKIDYQYEAKDKSFKIKAGIFLTSVAGISALVGFGTTVASVKKKDPAFFNKGVVGTQQMTETGASLAMRALGWGTLYAVAGCTVFFYSIWKLAGVNDMKEFRMKVGSLLPRIPKNDPSQGRTEFAGFTDLLTYITTDEGVKTSEN